MKEDGTPEDRKNKLLHAKQKNVWQMAVAECYSFEELDALSAKTQRDLAVLLATSPDDAVRDGKRANELVEEIGK